MRLAALRSLLASCHPGPVFAVTVMSTAYALDVGRSAEGVLAVTAAVLSGQISVGWQNDAIDAARDRTAGRTDKPVARGAVTARAVGLAAVLAGIATVPLSLWSGWRAGLVHIGAVILATAYNLGLKSTLTSPLPYVGAFGLLPLFITMGAPGVPLPPWWVPAATALLGLGAHFLNVVPDREHDRLTGIAGLPQRLGAGSGIVLAGLSLGAASALLAFGSGRTSALRDAGFAAAVLLVLGACAAAVLRPSRRLAFHLVIGLAGLDVTLLLATGHR